MLVQKKRKRKAKSRTNRIDLVNAASIKRAAAARLVAAKIIAEPSTSVGAAMRGAGLSEYAAQHPNTLTKSKEWADLLDEYLPQDEVLETHRGLLRASNLDHMVFPAKGEPSDEEITAMLAEKNCTVRRIVHGEQTRHVYFWAADNRARKDALDMVYKLRGTYAAEKHLHIAFSLVGLGKERQDALLGEAAQADLPQLKEPSMGEIDRS